MEKRQVRVAMCALSPALEDGPHAQLSPLRLRVLLDVHRQVLGAHRISKEGEERCVMDDR